MPLIHTKKKLLLRLKLKDMEKKPNTTEKIIEAAEEVSEEPSDTSLEESEGSHVPVKSQLLVLAVILFLIFGTAYVPKVLDSFRVANEKATATVQDTFIDTPVPEIDEDVNHFEDISLQGTSAYVWDVQNQRALYKKNVDEQLPLASVTKLMTALVAFELFEEGTKIPVTLSAIKQDGSSGFTDGDTFTFKDILGLTLLSSSNDGAYAIAAAVGAQLGGNGEDDAATFVEAMNIRAKELGLSQTYFRNPTGLDISDTEGGAYGSARDMTFLMEYILTHYPQILEQTQNEFASVANENGATYLYENTNYAVDRLAGLIGSKTGYTELAGGNLVVAFDVAFNRPVIVVVLNSSRNGRFDDVLALSAAARNAVQ